MYFLIRLLYVSLILYVTYFLFIKLGERIYKVETFVTDKDYRIYEKDSGKYVLLDRDNIEKYKCVDGKWDLDDKNFEIILLGGDKIKVLYDWNSNSFNMEYGNYKVRISYRKRDYPIKVEINGDYDRIYCEKKGGEYIFYNDYAPVCKIVGNKMKILDDKYEIIYLAIYVIMLKVESDLSKEW